MKAAKNAYIESRLIHARALIDFFEKPKRSTWRGQENDDVISTDYGFAANPLGIPAITAKD
jgi:hypothetical protein